MGRGERNGRVLHVQQHRRDDRQQRHDRQRAAGSRISNACWTVTQSSQRRPQQQGNNRILPERVDQRRTDGDTDGAELRPEERTHRRQYDEELRQLSTKIFVIRGNGGYRENGFGIDNGHRNANPYAAEETMQQRWGADSRFLVATAFVVALGLILGVRVAAQHASEQRDMALVGHDDLQARSAYQPTIQRQGNRWIAYIGHHGGMQRNPLTGKDEQNGTSIVDVTDPKKPRYLAHIPGEAGEGENGGAQMTRVCSGNTLPRADK